MNLELNAMDHTKGEEDPIAEIRWCIAQMDCVYRGPKDETTYSSCFSNCTGDALLERERLADTTPDTRHLRPDSNLPHEKRRRKGWTGRDMAQMDGGWGGARRCTTTRRW
ncbi:hypothetical protein B0H13DRAFT_1933832 [Mycena leptocephala]|nr:hypothetical protein B0H13DRAFT_1933832 [Mycena leptocephala]